jgi:antitoxin (DNA-binding transcriptional repressor) of toxin-antitoxin stability system
MTQRTALVGGCCSTAAFDWFPRVADELEMLEAGVRSWRSNAADLLRAVHDEHATLTAEDGDVLALVALELANEEDQAALDQGLVTWRSLAADEVSELSTALREMPLHDRP